MDFFLTLGFFLSLSSEKIDKQCQSLREKLIAQGGVDAEEQSRKRDETHAIAEKKKEEMKKIDLAFGMSQRDYVEGQAFDRELQQQRRMEAQLRREEIVREEVKRQMEEEVGRQCCLEIRIYAHSHYSLVCGLVLV